MYWTSYHLPGYTLILCQSPYSRSHGCLRYKIAHCVRDWCGNWSSVTGSSTSKMTDWSVVWHVHQLTNDVMCSNTNSRVSCGMTCLWGERGWYWWFIACGRHRVTWTFYNAVVCSVLSYLWFCYLLRREYLQICKVKIRIEKEGQIVCTVSRALLPLRIFFFFFLHL